ncbi:MAG: anthranilate phosphoribosyltransferase [Firmicutes bacterium]|nr:anthranilate phosphoribosyltransferase [Bacillota bacterium]
MLTEALEAVAAGQNLTPATAEAVMEEILSGRASDAQIAGLLVALRMKGETVDELVGFARAMRRQAAPVFPAGVRAPEMMVDTCGTGGDACGTFNVSTAAAFVVAGAGVPVAKHGNRSISSRCGSADVLEALGVTLELAPEHAGEAIARIGIGFLFAPLVHRAMRHAMRARRELRVRTVFNLLGPLTNPAGASAQVVGVFRSDYLERIARALAALGVVRAFVVHGTDGMDEISLSAATQVAEVRDGEVRTYTVVPEDFGLRRVGHASLAGSTAEQNAQIIRQVLQGVSGPPREIVLANAAAALVAAGAARDWLDGVRLAAESIDSGAAVRKLDALVEFTRTRAQQAGA